MHNDRTEERAAGAVEKVTGQWAINRLRPHPKQTSLIGDATAAEVKVLAGDIKANGLLQPVEITSIGVIICGHTRVRAATLLEWPSIECWIRNDLEALGEPAIEARMVEDNLHRRQLGLMAKVRYFDRLKTLEAAKGRRRPGNSTGKDRRDELAKSLGFNLSGKTFERLTRLLALPTPLQKAIDDKRMTQALGLKLVNLPEKKLREIADRVLAGEAPQKVGKEYVLAEDEQETERRLEHPRHIRKIKEDALRGLRAFRELGPRLDEVHISQIAHWQPHVSGALQTLKQLVRWFEGEAAIADDGDGHDWEDDAA